MSLQKKEMQLEKQDIMQYTLWIKKVFSLIFTFYDVLHILSFLEKGSFQGTVECHFTAMQDGCFTALS